MASKRLQFSVGACLLGSVIGLTACNSAQSHTSGGGLVQNNGRPANGEGVAHNRSGMSPYAVGSKSSQAGTVASAAQAGSAPAVTTAGGSEESEPPTLAQAGSESRPAEVASAQPADPGAGVQPVNRDVLGNEASFHNRDPWHRRRSYVDLTAKPWFGHAPDYSWLSGEVTFSAGSGWKLRFASVDESNPYGG